jgi:phosphonate transport system substrate-binding protein
MKLSKWSVLIGVLVVGALLLSACGGGEEPAAPEATEAAPTAELADTPVPPTPTPVPETPTPEPTPTPEGPPPGTEENPLVIAGVSGLGPMFHATVGDLLAEETGLVIESPSFSTDQELVDSLAAGETPHVVVLFPQGYLVANAQYGYEVALVGAQPGGELGYTGEILANADAGVSSLADAAGKSFCWTNPNSLAGYKVPRLMLWAEGIEPDADLGEQQEIVDHVGVVRAVYQGDCDLGATFSGAWSRVEDDYPDVSDRVIVVAESPLIPLMSVSFAPGVPDDVKATLIEGYQAVAASDDGAEAMGIGYGWTGVEETDDSLFEPLRDLIRDAKAEIDALL